MGSLSVFVGLRVTQRQDVERALRYSAPWAAAAAGIALILFLWTAAPTITWRNDGADSGELAAAVSVLGVPHPPGYPTYVILGKLSSLLFPFGDVAHRLAIFSAISGAATVGFCVLVAGTITRPRSGLTGPTLLLAGLTLAVAPLPWSQSTIAEVYAPASTALSACLLLLVIRCVGGAGFRWAIPLAGAILGIGSGLHLTILFLGAAAVPALMIAGVRYREVIIGAGAMIAGMSVFLLIPVLAVREPVIAWGAPADLSGFLWTVTGALYRDLVFAVPVAELPARALGMVGLLTREIGAAGWLLALWGAWRIWEAGLQWFIVLVAGLAFIAIIYTLGYNSRDFVVYLSPVVVVTSILVAAGANWALHVLRTLSYGPIAAPLGLAALIAVIPVLTLALNFGELDISDDREAAIYAQSAFAVASEPGALIVADTDEEVFSLWYQRYVVSPNRGPAVVARGLLLYDWYRGQVRDQVPYLLPEEPMTYDGAVSAVMESARKRPVYVTTDEEHAAPGFGLEPAGPLFRVIPGPE